MSSNSSSADPSTAQSSTESGPLRILVVDDNPDVAECISLLLETLGHETAVANSGTDAIEIARRVLPHTMLIDIGMPQISGYELARRLRADPNLAGIRLIALSGYGQDEDRRRAIEAGFDAHVTKPAGSETLESVIKQSRISGDTVCAPPFTAESAPDEVIAVRLARENPAEA